MATDFLAKMSKSSDLGENYVFLVKNDIAS